MRNVTAGLVLAVLLAAGKPAGAVNGFVIGLEGQRGSWNADPVTLSESGSIPLGDAVAFTHPLHGLSTNGLNLHLGWNVLGWVAIEAALQTSFWTPLESATRGGVGLVGGRATYFPLQHWLLPERPIDVGLELGAGYAIAGGPTFGMSGMYVSTAASVEYYPVPWFSLAIGYRHYFAPLSTFYYDFNAGVTQDVDGFTAGWGTLFLATNFHLAPPR